MARKKINPEIEKLKKKIIPILKKNKVVRAGIFGSYARGEQKKDSDVDILVDPPKDMSLIKFVHVKYELENELGVRIDLVTYKGIHPFLRNQILNEEIKIL